MNNHPNTDAFADNHSPSSRTSLISDRFGSVSSLNASREIILQNMNGTYSHGTLTKKMIATEEAKNERFTGYPRNTIVYIVEEDEISLYQSLYRLPTRVEDFIELTIRHQKYFFWYLLCFLGLELLFQLLSYTHAAEAAEELLKGYKGTEIEPYDELFSFGIIIEFVYMAIYFPLGFAAIYFKSIRLYSWFSLISMAGLILQIILGFVNK